MVGPVNESIPEPWLTACERKGIRPSLRPLAAAAGVAHETVRKIVQGRNSSRQSMQKVADALGVDIETIYEWRSESPPDFGRDFAADPTAALLTTDEREAINYLIRRITAGREDRPDDPGTTTDESTDPEHEAEPEERTDEQQPRSTRRPVRGSVTRSSPYPGHARSASRSPQPDGRAEDPP